MNDMSHRVLTPPMAAPEEPDRPRHHRTGPFGVLDIGTTKIACLIGRTESDGTLRVLGVGWHRGRGVRAGGIVDLEDAEKSIRACVGQAEDMADTRLRSVTVNLSCGQPVSQLYNVQWPVNGRAVDEHDIRRVVTEGRARAKAEGREVDPRFAADVLDRRNGRRGRSARPVLHHADRETAHHRLGLDGAAFARRLHRALRSRHRRGGVGADGRRPRHAGGRRAGTRRHGDRYGRRHHRHGGVRRPAVAAHRATADRRVPCHQGPGHRTVHLAQSCRAFEDACSATCNPAPTTIANWCRCTWSARKSTRSPRCRAAWW